MQNDPQRCKIKLEKFHFNILWYGGVIKEGWGEGGGPGEVGLRCPYFCKI